MKPPQSVSEPDKRAVWAAHGVSMQSCRPILLPLIAFILLGLVAASPVTRANDKKSSTPKSSPPKSQKSDSTTSVESINRILARPELKGASVGVHVVRLSDGKTLFEHDADRQFIPASNEKLFTTAAALTTLGPDFEFKTQVGLAGRDLVVVGSGDPTIGGRFTDGDPTAYFRRWAAVLKEQRITHISGDLVLDDSYFDRQFVHPDWPKSDLGHWYAAPVSALVLNDSCIDVHIAPGSQPDKVGEVTIVPATHYFEVTNRTRTVRTAKEHAPRTARAPNSHIIQCDGGVYEKSQMTTSWLPVDDPVQYFGTVLREVLAAEGVQIDGSIKCTPGAGRRSDFQPRIVHRFRLQPVLEVTNKESQNLYAEMIFKTLGATRHDGSWNGGRQAVCDVMARLGLNSKSFVIDDGCGLSRSNRATPRTFTSLFVAMQRGSYAQEFRRTLSIAGVDGTLKKRLTDKPYSNRVWAKTGSISGVRSISGYVETRSGEWLAFSLLANDVRQSVRTVQDDFCKALVNWSDSGPTATRPPRDSSK